MREGWSVRVCLSDAATQFVQPLLFETLTGEPTLTSVFDEPTKGRMAHIDWARWADVLAIVPATANTVSKIAFGQSDDMLSALALAFEGPMMIAPAMNPAMLAQPSIQEALARLRARDIEIVEPMEGDVASGEFGPGKLAPNATILGAILETYTSSKSLVDKHVLITSGPTREHIDSVRYLSNRSSGKMGIALAKAARDRGAQVTLISGPTNEPLPRHVDCISVVSAQEMLAAAQPFAPRANLIIGAAAVADYRPRETATGKIRRETDNLNLELVANPDIIATLAATASSGCIVVGFAAEPSEDLAYTQDKLHRKKLHAIVHNDVSGSNTGFEVDTNALTLLLRDGAPMQSGLLSKRACANWLLDHLTPRFKS